MDKYFKTPDVAICFFAFCITSFPAVASISLGLFIVSAIVFFFNYRPELFPKLLAPFLVLFLVYCFAILYSPNKEYGIKVLVKVLAMILIPLAFYLRGRISVANTHHAKHYFVLGTFFWGLCSLFYATIQYFLFDDARYYTYYGLAEVLHLHPTYQSFYILASIFFLPACNFRNKKIKIVLYVFFVGLLLLLESRIAYIALVLLLIFQAYWFLEKRILKLLMVPTAIIVIYGVFVNPFSNRLAELKNLEITINEIGTIEENGINQRLWLWKNAWAQIQERPVFGFGLGSQKSTYRWAVEKDLLFNSYNEQYTQSAKKLSELNLHNQYLQYLYEAGIFGVALLCFAFFLIYKTVTKKKQYRELLLLFIFTVFMLTENMLDRQMGLYSFIFLVSLFVFSEPASDGPDFSEKHIMAKSK